MATKINMDKAIIQDTKHKIKDTMVTTILTAIIITITGRQMTTMPMEELQQPRIIMAIIIHMVTNPLHSLPKLPSSKIIHISLAFRISL